jgi:hypothetical protein
LRRDRFRQLTADHWLDHPAYLACRGHEPLARQRRSARSRFEKNSSAFFVFVS